MAICWIERVTNNHPNGTLEFRCADPGRLPRDRRNGAQLDPNTVYRVLPGETIAYENFALPWGRGNHNALWVSAIVHRQKATHVFDVIDHESWDWVRHRNDKLAEISKIECGSMGDVRGTNWSGWELRLESNGAINLVRHWREGLSRKDAAICGIAVAGGITLIAGLVVAGIAVPLGAGAIGLGAAGGAAGLVLTGGILVVGGTLAGGVLQILGTSALASWIPWVEDNFQSDPGNIQTSPALAEWRRDVALGRPATASSQYSADYPPTKANDGTSAASGGWSPVYEPRASWWQVDLGEPRQLSSVVVVSRQDLDQPETRRNFEVLASNDPDISRGHVVLVRVGEESGPHKNAVVAAVLDPNRYRYITVRKTAEEYLFLAKVHVFGRSPDLAVGKPASASSTLNQDWTPANANDGGSAERNGWSPVYEPRASWWQVDLGEARRLRRVDLVTRKGLDQPETRRNFQIWASNDPEMRERVVLGTQGAEARPFGDVFSAVIDDEARYRYIRAVKTAEEYFYIAKLCVYGE
jgi:hypothetical protein